MTNINDVTLANLKHYKGKWKQAELAPPNTYCPRSATLEYTQQLDVGVDPLMNDNELSQQLATAISLLQNIQQSLKMPALSNGKFTKAPSAKNDPLEFYISHCTLKQDSEIVATELFCTYKQWCNDNGSLSRGRRLFLDAIAQIGARDGITGVIRGKSYTFKNLALK